MRKNRLLFAIEVFVYTVFFVIFLMLNFCDVSKKNTSIIYVSFMMISFGWLFAYEFLFPNADNAVHYKMLKKHYRHNPDSRSKESYKRKGIAGVVSLWIFYLSVLSVVKCLGILTWQLFLMGGCVLFIMNSVFVRKKCLLSVLFLHNKNHCCKSCGINGWDYAIFSSALFFAPKISLATTILNIIIILISFSMLVVWEYNYYKYPYRFYPETNATLGCDNCIRKCGYCGSKLK